MWGLTHNFQGFLGTDGQSQLCAGSMQTKRASRDRHVIEPCPSYQVEDPDELGREMLVLLEDLPRSLSVHRLICLNKIDTGKWGAKLGCLTLGTATKCCQHLSNLSQVFVTMSFPLAAFWVALVLASAAASRI